MRFKTKDFTVTLTTAMLNQLSLQYLVMLFSFFYYYYYYYYFH